ncbi:MAG: sigma 54-interacting transcriptional regulator, partial [Bacillota bacterium]|nr:sigma 54-interacting transcriptional regulator [Bacillota bacterium]
MDKPRKPYRAEDVTDLEEAKRIIKEQESVIYGLNLRKEQYDSIMENMTELVERTNANYSLIYVNRALCRFYNCTPDELLGGNTMDLVCDEDKKMIYKMMEGVNAENPSYSYEYRAKKKDGSIVWMESVGRGFYDENGNILEYQDVSRDITRFKNIEEELTHKVEQRTKELADANKELVSVNLYLQNILSGISEGVVIVNDRGDSKFLNYGPNDIWKDKQEVLREYFREQILSGKSNVLNRLAIKNQSFTDVEMSCYSSKKIISFVASGVPLVADGDIVTEAILVLRPITEVHNMINRMSGAQARFTFKDIVTNSTVLQDAIFLAKQAAASDCNILIEGQSGTGKEMFAQSIHNSSNRRRGPFVAVNCGAIPRELIASELFGYAEGAFTGAKRGGKPGKFELANGGTLFLDEIGDMPMEQQIALLRVLQERRVCRVGGDREIPVDVRIICATNRNLLSEVMKKNFREDLFYRLNVINFRIPPLRERKEDILLLFNTFLMK